MFDAQRITKMVGDLYAPQIEHQLIKDLDVSFCARRDLMFQRPDLLDALVLMENVFGTR